MSIRQAAPPNLNGQPRVEFNKTQFESAIWLKGYDVLVYRAVQCPCKGSATNLTTCENCLGLGWAFINPLKTKGIITSINKDTQYKYWSPEFKGTVAVTLRDIEQLSFMDKVVLVDKLSILSEVQNIRTSGVQKFIFASYPVSNIESIFLFDGATNALKKLTTSEYSISSDNPYVVKLNVGAYPTNFNSSVSITYFHKMQYNVVDIPHDIRASMKVNSNGKNQNLSLPIQAIAQKSHYITGDSPKYDGTGIKDNSYL